MRRIIFYILLLSLAGCSNLKYLPADEKLYTGAEVKLVFREDERKKSKKLTKEIEEIIRPEPNAKFLGMRIKLWLYNIAGTPSGKGFKYWLKNKVGEPPVLFSSVHPETNTSLIDARLYNLGIFQSYTGYKIIDGEKKVSVVYESNVHEPYVISSISWPSGDDPLTENIRNSSENTLLETGEDYNLEVLETERKRIDDALKESGFFYFRPEFILFEADTTAGDKTVRISVSVKENTPYEALLKYRFNEVYVHADHSLNADSLLPRKDTLLVDGFHYITADKSYRPKAIVRTIFMRKDEIYSRKSHNMTLNRLMGLGVFKFVNIRFNEQDSLAPGYLNTFIYLTPLPRKSIRGEIELVSKSNNFVGPSLNLSFRNRNALKGAELLIVNLHGSFETQINGQYKGLFSYEFGPQVDLYFPRFILPFNIKSRSNYFIPKTRAMIGYDFLKRVEYFNLNSLKFLFGYKWNESIAKEHELNPININYTHISNQSDIFLDLLRTNPLLEKSFEEQFIAGLTYSYTYNEQVYENKINQVFFTGRAEFSGNTISFLSKTLFGYNPDPENPLTLAGAVYSQFSRFDVDLRNYYSIDKKNRLAARLYAGIGIPYGNSSTLPYIKQFFSGGSNSIRAFRARTLGPGSFFRTEAADNSLYLEQGGDMRLEGNLEYRFNIISILKGALFVDAGNIWLLKSNPIVPGGKFTSAFMKDIAVGTGFGLRFDVNFFVLRLDFAFPLRKPWLADGERWVVNQIKPWSPRWRGDNLLLNIAIGYPF